VIFGNILSGEDGEADKSTDTSGSGKHNYFSPEQGQSRRSC
jgi:hypothetical protein